MWVSRFSLVFFFHLLWMRSFGGKVAHAANRVKTLKEAESADSAAMENHFTGLVLY